MTENTPTTDTIVDDSVINQQNLASLPLPPSDLLVIPPPPEPLASVAHQVAAGSASKNFKKTNSTTDSSFDSSDSPVSHSNSHPHHSSSSSIHAFSEAEKTAFVKHINTVLADAPELSHLIPVDPNTNDIFEAVKDGILFCKLINNSVTNAIDEGKIIKYFKDERSKTYHQINNQNLAIEGAKKIGAIIVNLGAEDLLEGKPYLVFGLLWQIIKIGLLKEVTTEKHPELLHLVEGDQVANLPPEELLLKWFNYQLNRSGSPTHVGNFSKDIKDSEAYIRLMHRLNPTECSLDALKEQDPLKRADIMLQNAEKIGCRSFVTAQDVVEGNERLNLVFVANMFNKHIGSLTEEVQSENTTLTNENESLKTKISSLEKQILQLQETNQKQNTELNSIIQEKSEAVEAGKQLENERDELALKVHKIFELNEKLTSSMRTLDEEKKMLEYSNKGLETELGQVTSKLSLLNDELCRERVSLETSEFCGASLASDLEQLRSRHEKLEYLIEHLKIERMRSEMHVERLRILYNSFPTTEALCEAIYKTLTLEVIAQGATKCGYLTKKARNGNSWKYRYFVLRDNFLFYFRSDKDPNAVASGVIRVDDAVLRFAENPTKKDLKDQWLLCIEVPYNNEYLKQQSFFIAGDNHELEGWKAQIKNAAGWWTKKSSISSIRARNKGIQ